MRKLLLPAAAALALLAIPPMTAVSAAPTVSAAPAVPAAPHSVLTIKKVGGPNVKKNAILKASLAGKSTAKFLTGSTAGVTCKKVTFTDKVVKNPTKPGTAIEKLLKQTFASCSVKGISGATGVKSVKLNKLPYTTTIKDSKGFPVTVLKTNTTITLKTTLGTLSCTYTAKTTKGSASNKSQTISFSKQKFVKSSGVGECPKTGTFSATFGPVRDTSVTGSPHVFVN